TATACPPMRQNAAIASRRGTGIADDAHPGATGRPLATGSEAPEIVQILTAAVPPRGNRVSETTLLAGRQNAGSVDLPWHRMLKAARQYSQSGGLLGSIITT